MTREEVFAQLKPIFCEEFDKKDIQFSETTSSVDIEGWDSLAQVELIVAIENSFEIEFTSTEVKTWKNVGDTITSILAKLNK
jgi:acyl carrier protein